MDALLRLAFEGCAEGGGEWRAPRIYGGSEEVGTMVDLVFIVIAVAFFAIAVVYVVACDRWI